MFSADLSWNDNTVEKVGERRERRAKKREGSIASSTTGSKSGILPKNSITKTISFSSVKGSSRRPSTATLQQHVRNTSIPILESNPNAPIRDPTQQPDYVYSAKLVRKLPSGAPLDPPPAFASISNYSLPVRSQRWQSNDVWQGTNDAYSTTAITAGGTHKAWSVNNRTEAENLCQTYQQVQEEILALQNPDSILPQSGVTFYEEGSTRHSREPVELEGNDKQLPSIPPQRFLSNASARNHSIRDDTPKTKYVLPITTPIATEIELPSIFRGTPQSPRSPLPRGDDVAMAPTAPPKLVEIKSSPRLSHWTAPKDWDIVQSKVEIRRILDSDSSADDANDDRRQSIFTGSHFQRFVRRMESAGPRIILERLKEEWDLPGDRAMSDELQLEKHLWALTAQQLQCMERFARQEYAPAPLQPLPPITPKRRRKILELDGSIGEIYQLSAIYPNSRIYHLTKSPRSSSIPLPSQAVQHEVSVGSPTDSLVSVPLSTAAGVLPLPYSNCSMHHIRSTRLPTLLPASQLPALLAECHRVLKPGGVLELRLMDATPERRTMGPLLAGWLEERLLLGLEQDFKCQRPVALVPRWARDAGFTPLEDDLDPVGIDLKARGINNMGLARVLRLPAAATDGPNGHRDVVGQVGVLVARALWKDAWGAHVTDDYNEHWWWENPSIVEECRTWNTTWDVGTIYVKKEM